MWHSECMAWHGGMALSNKLKMQGPFCSAVYLLLWLNLPSCLAQCTLEVTDTQLFSALTQAGIVREADITKFFLQDLTYLCFVRSATDETRFDQVRVSFFYTFDTTTNQSAQATFSVCLATFRFSGANVDSVTQYTHITANATREDCQDCVDSSTFASPTFCRCERRDNLVYKYSPFCSENNKLSDRWAPLKDLGCIVCPC